MQPCLLTPACFLLFSPREAQEAPISDPLRSELGATAARGLSMSSVLGEMWAQPPMPGELPGLYVDPGLLPDFELDGSFAKGRRYFLAPSQENIRAKPWIRPVGGSQDTFFQQSSPRGQPWPSAKVFSEIVQCPWPGTNTEESEELEAHMVYIRD